MEDKLTKLLTLIFIVLIVSLGVFGQTPSSTEPPRNAGENVDTSASSSPVKVSARTAATTAVQDDVRHENDSEEEAAILPYYNNYLREYHLGPEDVISVEVFGQPNYSKSGIVVPPTSRISYPLIPGGVFVGGKTVDEVAADVKKKLDEYIIDPQVMVTLDKVGSARFSVLGKVGNPGVKAMSHRYNLNEAIAEAGGIVKEGDKSRVLLVRLVPSGGFTQTVIDMDKVMKGKAEAPYLVPGDQIIIPEKRWSFTKILDTVSRASALRILFGVPF